MKNIKHDVDDLRPEYRRSDFGEMTKGKYAYIQLDVPEFVRLWIACIGEDEGLKFIRHSPATDSTRRRAGDWTYEFDDSKQITLRYWLDELRSIEEPMSNPPFVTTPQERADLQDLLEKHVRNLKIRVGAR